MNRYAWLLAAALLAGCGGGSGDSQSQSGQEVGQSATPEATQETTQETTPEPAAAEPVVVAVAPAVRKVACGCSIESIGHCGDYIEIDGEFAFIANWKELGLGSMEWCGKKGVTAESSGKLKDGEFFAATLVVDRGD